MGYEIKPNEMGEHVAYL